MKKKLIDRPPVPPTPPTDLSNEESFDDGWIFCRSYVNKNGKKIVHPTGGVFRFPKRKK